MLELPQLASLDVEDQGLWFELLRVFLKERPTTLWRKLITSQLGVSGISFIHDPDLTTIGESRSINGLLISPPVLPSLVSKVPKYSNFTWG